MQEQEAIKRLELHKEWGWKAKTLEAIDMAINALKKQIPNKPYFEGDGYADGQLVYDTWICPCCAKHYEVDYEEYDHCPKCGQKIDWSDEDGES